MNYWDALEAAQCAVHYDKKKKQFLTQKKPENLLHKEQIPDIKKKKHLNDPSFKGMNSDLSRKILGNWGELLYLWEMCIFLFLFFFFLRSITNLFTYMYSACSHQCNCAPFSHSTRITLFTWKTDFKWSLKIQIHLNQVRDGESMNVSTFPSSSCFVRMYRVECMSTDFVCKTGSANTILELKKEKYLNSLLQSYFHGFRKKNQFIN